MSYLNAFTNTKPTEVPEIVSPNFEIGVELDNLKSRFPTEIEQFDNVDNLTLWNYKECNDDSPQELKQCRGLVYSGQELYVKTYPYTTEYVLPRDSEKIKEKNIATAFYSCEGTLIRVFNANDKWFVSTHKKLDAYSSKWRSELSYGEMFENALKAEYEVSVAFKRFVGAGESGFSMEKFFGQLDKTRCYTFILLNSIDNRIVCLAPERPTCYFTGTFDIGSSNPSPTFIDFPIPTPKKIPIERLEETVVEIDNTLFQGAIAITTDGEILKIFNENYDKYSKIRCGQHTLGYRYLQLRMNREERELLMELYPYHSLMDEYENILFNIAKRLKNQYIAKYVTRELNTVPQADYRILRKCHEWHVADRKNNRITTKYIIELMNTFTPSALHNMIKSEINK